MCTAANYVVLFKDKLTCTNNLDLFFFFFFFNQREEKAHKTDDNPEKIGKGLVSSPKNYSHVEKLQPQGRVQMD